MASYIAHRLLLMIPTLLGITLVVFFVMALAPGGVAASLEQQAQGMRPEERQALRDYYNRRYGLDDPLLIQYGRWLHNISPIGVWTPARGETSGLGVVVGENAQGQARRFGFKTPDLGTSYTRHQPVIVLIGDALPVTVLLNLLTLPIIYGTAILTGVYAGRLRGKLFDVLSSVILLALWSIPIMWAGVMLIGFLANKDFLYWFPTGGLHDTLAAEMAFLPDGEAAAATAGFAAYVIACVALAVALTVGAGALLVALGRGLRQRGGTSRWETLRLPVYILLLSLGVALLAYGGVALGRDGALPTRMPGTARGWLLDTLWHLVLPVICLAYSGLAFLAKLMRASVLENLGADFVRTARAKGVAERDVLWRHVLRNSLLPLITIAATLLPAMLSGSLIVEEIFSINGMGKLMIDAIFQRDREIILSVTFVSSLLVLLSFILRDILYALVDPRVSYD